MRILSSEELDTKIIDALSVAKVHFPIQFMYFELMYKTGLRVNEITDYKNVLVTENNTIIFPSSKNSHAREIEAHRVPPQYLKYLQCKTEINYYTYPSYLSVAWSSCLQHEIFRSGKKKITTHMFRHNLVKKMFHVEQMPIDLIQKELGHKERKTTEKYVGSLITCY